MHLTDEEVNTLNAARTVCATITDRCDSELSNSRSGEGLGRLAQVAYFAGRGCFDVLNIAHVYCDVELTDEQLYNGKVV